jgi:uncharacterized phage-like protein YoqJ
LASGRAADLKPLRVAWSGHRAELFAEPEQAHALIERESARLVREHARLVILSGGQRGVDLWAAAAARRLGLELHLLLPVPAASFVADWEPTDAAAFYELMRAAGSVRSFGSTAEGDAGYERRNQALAEECELLIVVWTGQGGGGTEQTLGEARRLGRQILEHRLEPSDYRATPGERGV